MFIVVATPRKSGTLLVQVLGRGLQVGALSGQVLQPIRNVTAATMRERRQLVRSVFFFLGFLGTGGSRGMVVVVHRLGGGYDGRATLAYPC